MQTQSIKERSKTSFDQQAANYDDTMRSQHARNLYPEVLKTLEGISFESVLDLGCGTGELLKQVSDNYIYKNLSGIDISPKMLEKAKAKLGDSATLMLSDAEKLPFKHESFDVVVCNDSFHHYPAPNRVLDEIYRVLTRKGVLIIGDCWLPDAPRKIMNFWMKHSKEGDVRMYSECEMKKLLTKLFCDIEWKPVGKRSCLVYAVKQDY